MSNNDDNKKSELKEQLKDSKERLKNELSNNLIAKELSKKTKDLSKKVIKKSKELSENIANNSSKMIENLKLIKNENSEKKSKIKVEIFKNNEEKETSNNLTKEDNLTATTTPKNKENYIVKLIKKKNFKRLIGGLIILIVILTVLNLITHENSKEEVITKYNVIENIVIKYKVNVHIDFEGNLIFSKYDVILSVGSYYETLKHGKNSDFTFELEEGKQVITFSSKDNPSISTDVKLDVDSNMSVSYKINCASNMINAKQQYIDKDTTLADDEIKMNDTKYAFVNQNYENTIIKLKEMGFTNIKEDIIYDITGDWLDYDIGAVESLTINGKDDYKKGTIYKKDAEVIIKYHLKKNDDPTRIKVPYGSATAKGKDYHIVENDFIKSGFTNVSIKKYSISDAFGNKNGAVKNVEINGESSFDSASTYEPNNKVVITYYELNNELGIGFAKRAFEKYGKQKYKYGFKCHWIMDSYAVEQRNSNTWYFKVGVTITNQYGAKYDTIAEGIVTGTDGNPTVKQFYVK